MYRLLNYKFIHNLFSVKTLQRFVAYLILSFAIALLIPTQANSHTNVFSSNHFKNQEVVTKELVAQANPGDGVIEEVFYVLGSYGVNVNYFYINGNCHGQDFYREMYPNSQGNGNFKLQVASASSTLKQSSTGNVAQTKQFNSGSVESAVQNVLTKLGFGGEVRVEGVYSNGQPCTFRLTQQQGCDYC